ncbi:erythrocyte membrane protein 1, partial [Plasmodium falciparum IGH-CR14]
MPKRKEKELLGLKHTKNITFNRVATQTYSDPIDEWTIEHNEDLLDIPSSSHDDILKIKDETYNIISTNNLYSYENNDTAPHRLGLPNIIPS